MSNVGHIEGVGPDATGVNGSLPDKIFNAIENLVELSITTAVKTGALTKSITTKINLLDGDITTEMDEEFVSGSYVSLREYHQQREDQGHAIIDGNVEALKSLIDLFYKTKPAEKPAG
jgi:hypothetical protein